MRLHKDNFRGIVDQLTARDPELKAVVDRYGYPPLWARDEGFESLVLIILEQQVSLASAFAAFTKLKQFLGGAVLPGAIVAMTDEELRSCYFSRQKSGYVRDLARLIIAGQLDLATLSALPEEDVREKLKAVKGIGDWTADVYLMFCLQRPDYFPLGDIALVNSLKTEKGLEKKADREMLGRVAETWKPWRTVASMILWHAYICRKSMKLPDSYKKADQK